MKKLLSLFFLSVFFYFGCQSDASQKTGTTSTFNLSKNSIITPIDSPVKSGAEPNLFVSENGQVYMSWVEFLDEATDGLFFSKLENGKWNTPTEIARGTDWFVNWADFPSFVVYKKNENHMAAHWLAKRAEGTYDYDVHVAQSKDGGKTWGKSFVLHTDGVAAEHGFVTLLPTDDGKILATWLDGRFTKTPSEASENSDKKDAADDHGHGHGSGGAMTLRTATFDIEGNLTEEKELDHRICDCCQTTATITPQRTLIAYRDRSVDEIRDIFFVEKRGESWSSPSAVYNDHWKIAGCPVNGPALASDENEVAVAWFSASEETPKVQVAFYKNETSSFSKPLRIDKGKPSGRVGIVLLQKTALVSWLEETEDGAEIRLAQITPNAEEAPSILITKTSAARNSGFPQIEKTKDKIIFAWTETEGENSTVKTAFIAY